MFSMDTIQKNVRYKKIQKIYFPKSYEEDKIKYIISKYRILGTKEDFANEIANYDFKYLSHDDIRNIIIDNFYNKPEYLGTTMARLAFKNINFSFQKMDSVLM